MNWAGWGGLRPPLQQTMTKQQTSSIIVTSARANGITVVITPITATKGSQESAKAKKTTGSQPKAYKQSKSKNKTTPSKYSSFDLTRTWTEYCTQ